MPKVKNLAIKLQTGSDNTLYASWEFQGSTTTTTSTSSTSSNGVKAGDLVSIKSGATYYNGVAIPSFVMNSKWYIHSVSGDRAVLGRDTTGAYNIMSPISTKYLTGGTGSSSSSSSSTTDNTSEEEKTLDHFEVKWSYDSGDGVWFVGSTSSTSSKEDDIEGKTEYYATYSIPDNAKKVKVTVKPISKKHTVNDNEVDYWTGTAVSATYNTSVNPPEKPSTPDVEIDKYKLTAKLENIEDPLADKIQFQVLNGEKVIATGTATVSTARASYSCTITAGGEYRVRCRAVNVNDNTNVYSEWSAYTTPEGTIPSTPAGFTECKANSETSVYLAWNAVATAKTYDIEYTTKKTYFDGSDQTTVKSGIEFTHFELTGLQGGEEYFFRIRAVNDDGESGWSSISSVVVGKKPAAPTTWSSTTTATTGTPVNLYWIHNTEDGSSQTYAQLELIVDGVKDVETIQNTTDEELKDKTSVYTVDTSKYVEGTKIQWRVKTAGITKEYGDWSVQRSIDVYAPPTVALTIEDVDGNAIETLTSFPMYIRALPGPETQVPLSYHLTITSNEIYETVDYLGKVKMVNAGDAVYSNYFDINEVLTVELTPAFVNLDNNISYTVTCTVSMDSGLTAEASLPLTVSWTDEFYEPSAEIAVDKDTYAAYIKPYCIDTTGNAIEDVTLSLYRIEFDGTLTELATGLDPIMNTTITDPHPALDYARYRIVAISKSTGAVSFYDPPGYPVNCKSVIIQWDEAWTEFYNSNEDEMEQPPWSGSMLNLPYNIDVSENVRGDVALVKYIGRTHPVSYYGTNMDTNASWNVVIPKTDKETVYALRRLQVWMGDVYVREPSGCGYWATINVSFSQKHLDVTIPVTLDITRVEGGV